MNPFYAYSFLVGMFIGGYTNFFSKIIISGLVLYMVNPENFNIQRFNPLYLSICDYTHPYISKFYTLENIKEENKIERVTIIPSPINLPPIKTLKIIKNN